MQLSRVSRLFSLGGIVMKSHVLGSALLSAIAIGANAPAHAQSGTLTRSFVSSSGLDTNSCMITAPCQTFAEAYTKIGANGIIAALDPGKYGPINIIGPVTINGNGWAAITAPAEGNGGITISAGSNDNVTLTGLEIDGAGAATNGIAFSTGNSLTVTNCVVKDFAGAAIQFAPYNTSSVLIKNTIVTNSQYGIYIARSNDAFVTAALDEITASNNSYGVYIYNSTIFTLTNQQPVEASISNSHIDNNISYGLYLAGSSLAATTAVLKNATINQTPNPISMNGYSTLYVSQLTSTIVPGFTNNGGIINAGSNNAVFSDGTSHFGSSQVTLESWALQ
jgi:hypothetical protein